MASADWKILLAHVEELEALEDELLRSARGRGETSGPVLQALHRHIMEKRKRLRDIQGN